MKSVLYVLIATFSLASQAQVVSTLGTVYSAPYEARMFVYSSNYKGVFSEDLTPGEIGAVEYCASVGGRLPTNDELTALAQAKLLDLNFWYWSSSPVTWGPDLVYRYSPYSEVFREDYQTGKNAVACVPLA